MTQLPACKRGTNIFDCRYLTECICEPAGTVGGSKVCDKKTGQCPCREHLVGLSCTECEVWLNERNIRTVIYNVKRFLRCYCKHIRALAIKRIDWKHELRSIIICNIRDLARVSSPFLWLSMIRDT